MAVVLLILKILGIVILVLLGLIIVLILTILFAPFIYRVQSDYKDGNISATGRVSWLLGLIRLLMDYGDELHISIKVLFFEVYRIGGSDKGIEPTENETIDSEGIDSKIAKDEISIVNEGSDSLSVISKIGEEDIDKHTASEDDLNMSSTGEDKASIEIDDLENSSIDSASNSEDDNIYNEETQSSKRGIEDIDDIIEELIDKIYSRMCIIFDKLCDKYNKVGDAWNKLIRNKNKLECYIKILEKERTQELIKKILRKIGNILYSYRPRNWHVNAKIGNTKPDKLGKVMALYGIAYSICGDHIKLSTTFEEDIMEANGSFKGHIILVGLIRDAIWFICSRDVKRVKRQFDNCNRKYG